MAAEPGSGRMVAEPGSGRKRRYMRGGDGSAVNIQDVQ